MTTYKLTTFKVKLQVQDTGPTRSTTGPAESEAILRSIYESFDGDQEHFAVLALNGQNQVTGYKVLSSGGMGYAHVDQKLLWRAALALGGVAIILAHNHPSGDPTPSPEDRKLTTAVQEAAALLDFRLLDHIILGEGSAYYSFANSGML